nr:Lycopene beta-cyclase [Ipomoea batatas]
MDTLLKTPNELEFLHRTSWFAVKAMCRLPPLKPKNKEIRIEEKSDFELPMFEPSKGLLWILAVSDELVTIQATVVLDANWLLLDAWFNGFHGLARLSPKQYFGVKRRENKRSRPFFKRHAIFPQRIFLEETSLVARPGLRYEGIIQGKNGWSFKALRIYGGEELWLQLPRFATSNHFSTLGFREKSLLGNDYQLFWKTCGNREEAGQREILLFFGMDILLKLDLCQHTRMIFDAFFDLETPLFGMILSSRLFIR